MSSTLDQSGLTIESNASIVTDLVDGYKNIYGSDINVDSNSPDGQLIAIIAQIVTDLNELLLDAYNAMAIDTSYGQRLDQLVALNGISRVQGTYTLAYVNVTATAAVTIYGTDQTAQTPFTVQDDAGNQFQLVTTYAFGAAGTQTLAFRAVDIGNVPTTANTITNIATATLGISAVNNPSVASDVIGVDEETDAQLKTRQAKSLRLAATGLADSMEAALKEVSGVTDALVQENETASTVNGVPAHGVWAIVAGGSASDIAAAIYAKKSPGCSMAGAQTYDVVRPNGSVFTAMWDNALSQTLYVKFSITWIGPQTKANADIATALAAAMVYKLGQNPNIGDIIKAMATIAPTAVVSINSATQGVSDDNVNWESVVQPTDYQHYFVLAAANVTIS